MYTKNEFGKERHGWNITITTILTIAFITFSCNKYASNSDESYSEEHIAKIYVENVDNNDNTDVFTTVETMPSFPGGDKRILNFIASNTKYPQAAKLNGIEGKVIVRFCVEASGKVSRVSILKGVDTDLDYEAYRVVSSLPKFSPGIQNGKAVPVWYMVPVNFVLNKKSLPATDKVFAGESSNSDIPFVVVEEMPYFAGGESELFKYVAEHLNYPLKAKENGIQGRVIVRFCVEKTGKIDRISIIKGVDPLLDAEAYRVTSKLPDFIPGKQNGKTVPVWCMMPIEFKFN
jgi:TonB family protein